MESKLREVYENIYTHILSFEYAPNASICVGETNGSLETWIDFHNENLKIRGLTSYPEYLQEDRRRHGK